MIMKKRYLILTIGILFILVLVILMGIKKQRVSYEQQILPVLDTPGKSPLVSRIQTLTTRGGRVDWSPKGDLIAFDRLGEDGYYDVWLMELDGNEQRCLTCDKAQLPQKHNGNPVWSPDGKYLVFQSVDPNLKGLPFILSEQEKLLTGPGVGINNNIWLMTKNGDQFWQLTHIADKMGLLHPHFSHDGKKLLWAERVSSEPKPQGQWVIKIADLEFQHTFVGPDFWYLANIQSFQPVNMRFYETHGFTPDNQKVIFSATPDGLFNHLEIYLYDLKTEELKQLTGPDEQWDEHAQLSPDGKKIVWMSSRGIEQELKQDKGITEFWLMNADGSGKQRLTYFNDSTASEYLPIEGGIVSKDNSWSLDGKKIVAYISKGTAELKDRPELIVLIELE